MRHRNLTVDQMDPSAKSYLKHWEPLFPPECWEDMPLGEAAFKLKYLGLRDAGPKDGDHVKKCCASCDCFLFAPREHNSKTNRSCMKIMIDQGVVVFVVKATEVVCDGFRFEAPMTYTKYNNNNNQDQSFKMTGMKSIEIKPLSKEEMGKTREESIASIREILSRPPEMIDVNALYSLGGRIYLGHWEKYAHGHEFTKMIRRGEIVS